jgi:hypothetical protein
MFSFGSAGAFISGCKISKKPFDTDYWFKSAVNRFPVKRELQQPIFVLAATFRSLWF